MMTPRLRPHLEIEEVPHTPNCTVVARCRCGAHQSFMVPTVALRVWLQADRKGTGPHIQEALPMLSDNEREAILTGLCPACWDTWLP